MTVEYDVHGLVGVRVEGGTGADVAAVDRPLGPLRARLDRPPDVTIRFVDDLVGTGRRRLVGDSALERDGDFLVLTGAGADRRATRLPFDRAAPPWEIACEHGVGEVPLLVPFLNLAVLAAGALPLHGAAFVEGGRGVVMTGWSSGGKTSALLAFTASGATFVGDDWLYVERDGAVHGVPEPIHVGGTHLAAAPALRRRLPRREVRRLTALGLATRVAAAATAAGGRSGRLAGRLAGRLEREARAEVAPEALFGPLDRLTCTLDVVFLMATTDDPAPVVTPVATGELAARALAALRYERLELLAAYYAFRYAAGRASGGNALIEGAATTEQALLEEVFAGVPAYEVRHPRPVDPDVLRDAMAPYC